MSRKEKKNEMVVAEAAALLPEGVDFETLAENLQEMDELSFPRIPYKDGKFYLENDDDDEGVDEFEGVLLFYGRQNTYWKENFDSKNIVPPDCFSVDGKMGSLPRNEDGCFGECKSCLYNKFGSGIGKGKACRNQMKLYIHVLGTTIPKTLFLAPTSLGAFTHGYIMNKITQRGLSYFRVITKFKAFKKKDENFWRVGFDVVNTFSGEEADKVKEHRDYWLEPIKNDRTRLDSSVTGGDKEVTDEPGQKTVEPRKPAAVSSGNESEDDDPPF